MKPRQLAGLEFIKEDTRLQLRPMWARTAVCLAVTSLLGVPGVFFAVAMLGGLDSLTPGLLAYALVAVESLCFLAFALRQRRHCFVLDRERGHLLRGQKPLFPLARISQVQIHCEETAVGASRYGVTLRLDSGRGKSFALALCHARGEAVEMANEVAYFLGVEVHWPQFEKEPVPLTDGLRRLLSRTNRPRWERN